MNFVPVIYELKNGKQRQHHCKEIFESYRNYVLLSIGTVTNKSMVSLLSPAGHASMHTEIAYHKHLYQLLGVLLFELVVIPV